jgi:cephalosporin hydroxylase
MPQVQKDLMQRLYGGDVWEGYVPVPTTDKPEGWAGDHPSLSRLASSSAARVVIDVGVWKGQSTITMACAMKDAGIDGCVIGVDTFLGSVEHWDWQPPLFKRINSMPDIFQTFMSNVVKARVTDYVIPLAQTSITAAAVLWRRKIFASVVHIDAAHEYEEVLRDCEEYWTLLASGGYLIGDDYLREWPGVVRAAGEFSAKHGIPLTVEHPKWILRKP